MPYLNKRNKILIFISSRYIGYFLVFLRGIFIAIVLGPNIFGLWGFCMLIMQYSLFTNMGIQYAITVQLSKITRSEPKEIQEITNSALFSIFVLDISLLVIGLIIKYFASLSYDSFQINDLVFLIIIKVCIEHIYQIQINIFRVYGKLLTIAICEVLMSICPLITFIFFDGIDLIYAILLTLITIQIISIMILGFNSPIDIRWSFDYRKISNLLLIGIPLLLYNASFHFILISTRTIISIFYSIEILGYYTFANSFTRAVMLGFSSIIWILFPKIISKMKEDQPDEKVYLLLLKITQLYSTIVNFSILFLISFTPILFIIMDNYLGSRAILTILLVSQGLLACSLSFNTLAISRGKHTEVASIGIFSTLLVFGIGGFCAYLNMNYIYIALSTLLASFIFLFRQVQLSNKILNISAIITLKTVLSIGTAVSFSIVIINALFINAWYLDIIAFSIFFRENYDNLKEIMKYIMDFQKYTDSLSVIDTSI